MLVLSLCPFMPRRALLDKLGAGVILGALTCGSEVDRSGTVAERRLRIRKI
jgi:hypothetical protein